MIFVHFDFEMCFAPQRHALFRHLNFQKWSEASVCFVHVTWKGASCHNGIHLFNISTSKSGLKLVCFVHFDLDMCFEPRRRALFRHRNFQRCSERRVFLAFSLASVLGARTACNFSSLIWPDTRRFGEPTFRPSRAKKSFEKT